MIALIPARSGSKSIKDKNILPLKGYPVLAWSITVAKQCDMNEIYVMTDSLAYGQIAERFKAKVILQTKEQAEPGDMNYLKPFFEQVETDEVVLLRPTTPLRKASIMLRAIDKYLEQWQRCTAMRSAYEMSETAYKTVRLEGDWFLPILDTPQMPEMFNMPREKLPKTYHPNGYIDIIKRRTIENGSVYGDKILSFITDDVGELDSPIDVDRIKWLLNRGVGQSILNELKCKKVK